MSMFLQISDTHVVPEGQRLYTTVDSRERLRFCLDSIREAELQPDAIVMSGDISDHGEADGYRFVRGQVEQLANEVQCPVFWVNGNHDERDSFCEHLLDGADVDRAEIVAGVKLVMLDSAVSGENYGRLTASQLSWLDRELSRDEHLPAILVMHHPPIPSPLPGMSDAMLSNQKDLADVLTRHASVQLIATGHAHYSGAGSLAGVPVWVCGASAVYSDVAPPHGRSRVSNFGSYSRIDVVDGRAIATAIPLCQQETVLDFQAILDGTADPELLAAIGWK
jgi:Icc protein